MVPYSLSPSGKLGLPGATRGAEISTEIGTANNKQVQWTLGGTQCLGVLTQAVRDFYSEQTPGMRVWGCQFSWR